MSRHNVRGSKGKFVRADGTSSSPIAAAGDVLLAMSIEEMRYCVVCGHGFQCYVASRRMTCSPACNTRRWRWIGILAGTHAYVDGQFRRL